ncbi:hypothetical protein EZV62_012700 [Acer yangbiense]|uniref:ABC transporter domain-containing protein n=1 Tax=Acer yangbiense TaxID=1000413 RepID=A0A5C7HW31_9ROSI|nr:hypothetical protein EZV62_012700 [Acer yangbiense]
MWNSAENVFSRAESFREEGEDEEALRWAALERLPTYARVRRGIFKNVVGDTIEIDVSELQAQEQKLVLDRLVNSVEDDPERFFDRMRKRFDAVDLDFPKIEVRFQNLIVESFVHVGSRALPTIPNFIFNMTEALLRQLRIYRGKRSKLTILDNVNGIIRPSRMTLLLGPPSSGKTTLLLALAGRLQSQLQMSGRITYNGHGLKEFVPPRTSSYVSQQDLHAAEMTVRETLEFAGRCQGVGFKYDMISELARREKIAGIKPDEDLDIFMKSLALGGQETSLVVEYIMKPLNVPYPTLYLLIALRELLKLQFISLQLQKQVLCYLVFSVEKLWLDLCADTLVGDEMLKGISGGQKKRLTTGELLVGPARVLFMDEISNGLDSSTTYQIIKYLKHSTRALDGTTVISLLQPAPEAYELFDDVILLCEGQIVYQGPRDSILDFFTSIGFSCPKRKNVADFLQEVTSKKDQEQYWSNPYRPYQYIPPGKFAEAFRSYRTGKNLSEELDVPFDRRYNHPAALSTSQYGEKKRKLLKTSFDWQLLLMKRNSFIYVFKFIQLLFVALITMTVFIRTTMHHETIDDGSLYLGALYFSMVIILFNGFTEVSMLVAKLPVIYKHRDLHFYPSWVYTLPSWALSIPTSLIESGFWVAITYYVIGYDPNVTRFLQQFLLYFFLHQMSIGLFRVIGSLGRNMIVANTFGSFAMLVVMALGGFIISRERIPSWWIWGYWVSPLMYSQNAASVNEFLGHSWDKLPINSIHLPDTHSSHLAGAHGMHARAGNQTNISLGEAVLRERSLFPESYWYWIGVVAMLGYTVLFNILFTFFLGYLNPLGNQRAVVSKEELQEREKRRKGETAVVELREYFQHSGSLSGKHFKQRGMVLPFQPHSMSFRNINYFVDVPLELKQEGIVEDRRNKELVENLSKPSANSKELNFPSKFSQSFSEQFLACLWKQNLSYWRNPQYTAVRFFYTTIISLMLGSICWKFGSKRCFHAVVVIEFPYVFAQTVIYCSIFYSMASFEWSALKFIWYIFFMYLTMLYFTFYGMMTTAITPNHNVAAIIAAPFYMLWNLFSGFTITHKRMPIYWSWYYWGNPVAWSLYGLLTSQYGDDDRPVKLADGIHSMPIRELLRKVFGFRHDFLGMAGVMVVVFATFFAVIFAYAIKSFKFQKR